MTTLAPQVVSAISGGAHRPWHYARTESEWRRLIDELLGGQQGHVLLYAWDRPAGGEADQYPRHQLKIVYTDGVGAAHFSNGDPARGPIGAWLTQTEQAPINPPRVVYDPWDPHRVTLPATALLPIQQLRELAKEYATTGQRPVSTTWTPVDWV